MRNIRSIKKRKSMNQLEKVKKNLDEGLEIELTSSRSSEKDLSKEGTGVTGNITEDARVILQFDSMTSSIRIEMNGILRELGQSMEDIVSWRSSADPSLKDAMLDLADVSSNTKSNSAYRLYEGKSYKLKRQVDMLLDRT